MNLVKLEEQLALEEGSPAKTYRDSKGILTGGIGHNLEDEPEPGFEDEHIEVPPEMRTKWFRKDIQDAIDDLDRNLPWWRDLDDVRQNALLNLCFNMGWMQGGRQGTGLSSFKNSLAAFERGDYLTAAHGFGPYGGSAYARDVGPTRSGRIAAMIRTGNWQL